METSSMSMGASIMAHQELSMKLRALQQAESYVTEISEYTKQLRSEIMSFVSEQVDVPTGSVIKELGGEILFYYAEVPFYQDNENLNKYLMYDKECGTGLREHYTEWSELSKRVKQLRSTINSEIGIIKAAHPGMDLKKELRMTMRALPADYKGEAKLFIEEVLK